MMIRLLYGLLALAMAACRQSPDVPPVPPPPGQTDTVASSSAQGDGEVLTDTIYVEGQAMPVALERFDEPGLPFTTAFPERDFLTETIEADEGKTVQFYANFGGVPNRAASVTFFFADEAIYADTAALDEALRATIQDRGWQMREDVRPGELDYPCPWAQVRHTFVSEEGLEAGSGYACTSTRDGMPFYLLVHIPVEYADGFGPRLQVLLDHFRWRDTGDPLRPSANDP